MRTRVALLVVVCAVAGCGDKSKKDSSSGSSSKSSSSSASSALATLVGPTWTGKLDKNNLQMVFTGGGKKDVSGELRYTVFGAVRSRDKVTASVDAQGTVHLKPTGTANVLVGGKGTGVDELRGTLSADKATFSGTSNGGVAWSVSTAAQIADLDPPIDLVAAEKALVTAKWEGKLGPRPAKLVITKKAGRLTAKMTVDHGASSFQVDLDATGHLTLKGTPRPTAQGLLTETGRGYFLNRELKKLRGSLESSVKQGFIEQSGETAWSFEDLRKPKK